MNSIEEIHSVLDLITIESRMCDQQVRIPRQLPINAKRANGVSKYCLIFPDLPFVIKFPKSFRRGQRTECQDEADFYVSSANYRIQKVLLPTELFYTNQYGIKFYKQTKIAFCAENTPVNKRNKYYRMTEKIPDQLIYRVINSIDCNDRTIDTLWLKMVWLLHGEKFTRALVKWMIDNRVNDLHNQNIGYLNDKPVIMDYSGYHR